MKIEYTKVGDYYLPNLYYPEETRPIGCWGMFRKEYLKEQGLTDGKIEILKEVLAQDPRPHYQKDPHKVYGMPYEGLDIHFTVCDHTLTVVK